MGAPRIGERVSRRLTLPMINGDSWLLVAERKVVIGAGSNLRLDFHPPGVPGRHR